MKKKKGSDRKIQEHKATSSQAKKKEASNNSRSLDAIIIYDSKWMRNDFNSAIWLSRR